MKTAKQFLDSILKPNPEGLYDGVGPGDLREYARQACEEQRCLCAESAELKKTVQYSLRSLDPISTITFIDKESILNAPSPL